MARKFPNRISIYVTNEDRANMERLMRALTELGNDFTDQRGNLSYSAMLRWLVRDTLKKLGAEFKERD